MNNTSGQVINFGKVIGFVSDDIVIITDGVFTVQAYNPSRTKPSIGQAFSVSKQGSTYFVGAEVQQ